MKFLSDIVTYFKNKYSCHKNRHSLFIGKYGAGATTYTEYYGCLHCKHKSNEWFGYKDDKHKSEIWKKSYTNKDGNIDLRLVLGGGLMFNPIIKTT